MEIRWGSHSFHARHRLSIGSTLAMLFALSAAVSAQQPPAAQGRGQRRGNPQDTEVWEPVPKVVTPGAVDSAPPSDAIVLFDGKNLDEWVNTRDKAPANWTVADGVMTVSKARGAGNIETKRKFHNFQLHVEWKIPANVTGTDQARGNSGIFLASTGGGDAGYELQILDSYNNKTYANGQAGSIYKQGIPLVNPVRKPGEWQSYDVIWMAPVVQCRWDSADARLRHGIHERRAGAEPFRIAGRDAVHRQSRCTRSSIPPPSNCRPIPIPASRTAFATSGCGS